MSLRQILKEPLLHFLLIGALLFGAYAWTNRGASEQVAQQVRLAEADVKWLTDTFALEHQRQPTPEELHDLVHGLLKEELFAREAQERGLDKDDIVVRRRLAQKMTFLLQDNSARAEPSEAELRAFYETRQDLLQSGPSTMFTRPRISFAQIFFSRDRADAATDARKALQKLSDGGKLPPDLGDRSELAADMHDADERAVANRFGSKFAAAIFAVPPGAWQGPIESSRGLHLVRVSELAPGHLRPFEEIRGDVLERWREERQRENEERYFVGLLKKYRIVPDASVKDLLDPLPGQAEGRP
jgi:PPIC-type PPIASE domain